MTVLGKPGDAQNFSRLAQRDMNLFKIRNGYELSPKAILHCLERIIAEQGRSSPIGLQPKISFPQNPLLPSPLGLFPDVGNPGGFPSTKDTPPSYGRVGEASRSEDYSVEVLLGGYDDKENKAWLSTIGGLGNANYFFCGSFKEYCLVIMDTLYNPAMTVDEGIEAVSKCVEKSRKRFVIKPLNVVIIDKNGARKWDRDLVKLPKVVNEDSTYVALISKKYVYVFGIPDVQKGAVIPKHADLDKGVPKLTVSLVTLGPMPNHNRIYKVEWFPSTIVYKSIDFGSLVGVLYHDSLLRIFDVKFPEIWYDVNFKSAVLNSVKEDQLGGFGLNRAIISFDFGSIFNKRDPFSMIYAVDNEGEIYYCGLKLKEQIKPMPIIGPILLSNNGCALDPVDLKFFKHPDSASVPILLVAQMDGSVAHVLGFPEDDWSCLNDGKEFLKFFVHEVVQLQGENRMTLMSDPTAEGEYIVCMPDNIVIISILPWLSKLGKALQSEVADPNIQGASVACHVFHSVKATSTFCSIAPLILLSEEYERYLAVVDSNCDFHGKFVAELWEDLTLKKDGILKSIPANIVTLITENPVPANVPILNGGDEPIPDDALPVCTNVLRTLGQQIETNILIIQEAYKKASMLQDVELTLFSDHKNLHERVIQLADEQKELQPTIDDYLSKLDCLRGRIDMIFAAVPKEKLTDVHLENEERIYKQKKKIQETLSLVRETSVKAILLRSEHFGRQPSFQPSAAAAKFMLTKSGVDAEELKNQVTKLSKQVAKLVQLAEYAHRMSL
uniref:Nuclear pore complex protein Nup88 n=1 Tax=Panagrolaimus sp. JU765 TaxID=591449 RepID=A0AC34QDA4_9BILA